MTQTERVQYRLMKFLSWISRNTAWLRIQTSESLLPHAEPDTPINEYYKINSKGDILESGEVDTYFNGSQYKTVNYRSKCLQQEKCKPQVNK